MNFEVIAVPIFKKEIKRLVKKYPSLKQEFLSLAENLAVDPYQGTSLGNNCYKIRIAISSKGKGKSGGARIITHIIITVKTVFLLSIYDKSEKQNLTDAELKELLKDIPK